ncbi:hypothetical protein DdX_05091 [Ditylenchus destructor]|uniref:Uncharacterized protein n=1 Tax=Ditylenchus destructor TaxID=166010 RepID=A0AAD4N7I4_9BILA|nr:hypothetical protein DdX_05091 [Ditylenchus destructor]
MISIVVLSISALVLVSPISASRFPMRPRDIRAAAIAVQGSAEADATACQTAYWKRINQMCTYPDQTWPCLKGSRFVQGQIQHPLNLNALTMQACQGAISLNDMFQNLCCFTPDCLEKCYGIIPDLDNNLFIKASLGQI